MAFEEMMNDPAIGGGMPPQGPPMGGPPQGMPPMGMPPQGMPQPGGPNPEEVMEKMTTLRTILEKQKEQIDSLTKGFASESAQMAMMPPMGGPTGMPLPAPPSLPPMGGMPPMGPQGPPMPPMGGPPMPPMGPIA